MTARRAIVSALALGLLALLFWKLAPSDAPAPAPGAAGNGAVKSPAPGAGSRSSGAGANGVSSAPDASSERSALADTLNSPKTDIRSDLRVVSDVIEAFRTNFPNLGNPTGSNDEITAVLTGKNRLRLALIPRDHPAINKAGELCDRWGTPFFFHAESATKMSIRSAGPDKKMWNEDDVVFEP